MEPPEPRERPGYRIQPMRLEDLPEVQVVDRLAYPSPWPEVVFRRELANFRHSRYLVARPLEGGAVVGFAGMWQVLDEAHVTTIAVHPEHRGRKLGELLFLCLLEIALVRGATFLTLEVRKSNVVAQSLYRKYGLEVVGERKAYYTDNREDALLMTVRGIQTLEYRRFLAQRWEEVGRRLRYELELDPLLVP